MMGIYPAKY